MPSNSGQFGLALTQTVEEWGTKFGVHFTQFHSRRAKPASSRRSARRGAPYVPRNPDGLNPTYFLEWPENVRMFALTFETRLKGATAFGELIVPAEPAAAVQRRGPAERGRDERRTDAAARPRERPAARRDPHGLRAAQGGAVAAGRGRAGSRRARRSGLELGCRGRLQEHPRPARPQRPALRAVGRVRARPRQWRLPAAGRARRSARPTATSRATPGASGPWWACATPTPSKAST